MSSTQTAFPAVLDSTAQLELIKSVIGLLPFHSLLPPPITVRLQRLSGQSEGRLEASIVVGAMPSGDDSDAFCEVTGCLDPHLCSSSSRDASLFRQWAVRNPEHLFAVRYQPLLAWLLAARCDSSFMRLADDFVRRERIRLQGELMTVATRVLIGSRPIDV